MAELDIVQRRSLTWVWWLVGILLVLGLMWAGTVFLSSPEDVDGYEVYETEEGAQGRPPQAGTP